MKTKSGYKIVSPKINDEPREFELCEVSDDDSLFHLRVSNGAGLFYATNLQKEAQAWRHYKRLGVFIKDGKVIEELKPKYPPKGELCFVWDKVSKKHLGVSAGDGTFYFKACLDTDKDIPLAWDNHEPTGFFIEKVEE